MCKNMFATHFGRAPNKIRFIGQEIYGEFAEMTALVGFLFPTLGYDFIDNHSLALLLFLFTFLTQHRDSYFIFVFL